MPERTPGSREAAGDKLKATDMILPEISQEALLSSGGKLLTLFFARRLTAQDYCFRGDILLLYQQFKEGRMPLFSNNNLAELDTPFVDPLDDDENIRSLSKETSEEGRAQIMGHFETGRLVHADVWIALKLRRASLVAFIEVIVCEHQSQVTPKPSPTYAALLEAELAEQQLGEAPVDEVEKVEKEETEKTTTADEPATIFTAVENAAKDAASSSS
jgi:hypothetical protein